MSCVISESPRNSGFEFSAISAAMQATDQMSTEALYRSFPIKISGGLYHRVTTCSRQANDSDLRHFKRIAESNLVCPVLLSQRDDA